MAILAKGYSGGILVAWSKTLGRVSPLAGFRHALHLIISHNSLGNWIVSIFYNALYLHSQCSLWLELSKMSSLNIPWLIVGDFNDIVTNNEHKGVRFSYYSRKTSYFLNLIDDNNLLDLYFIGPKYTWCNNQNGMAQLWARLDHCLVNMSWSSKLSNYTLRHLVRIFSDHGPLLLSITLHNSHKRVLFHFANHWLNYIRCHLAVRRAYASFQSFDRSYSL